LLRRGLAEDPACRLPAPAPVQCVTGKFANDVGAADYVETINGRIDFERALSRTWQWPTAARFGRSAARPSTPMRLAGKGGMKPVSVVAGSLVGHGRGRDPADRRRDEGGRRVTRGLPAAARHPSAVADSPGPGPT